MGMLGTLRRRVSLASAALLGKPLLGDPRTARLAYSSYRASVNPRRRARMVDGSGDYHLDSATRMRCRSLSRELERNSDLYDGFLSNWSTYLVGSGPRPIFTTKSQEFNRAAVDLFKADASAKLLDGRRMFPWANWVALLARAVARDGDAAIWHNDDGSGVILESERVHDVQTDLVGRISGYELAQLSPGGQVLMSTREQVPAQRISLAAWRTRASQTRGHPSLVAGLDDWERLDSLNESEIISAEAASLPWLVVSHQASSQNPAADIGSGATNDATAPAGNITRDGWIRSDSGSILGLPPGLDGKPWIPDRPNLNVPEFVKMNLRHLCLPLLPYEIAFLDIGNLNYAGIRGLGKLGQRKLADFRTLILEDPLSRIARDWARVQILAKRLPFTPDFANLRWEWDLLEVRDREKDAKADQMELENGTSTLLDIVGPAWQNHVDQRAREAAYLRSKGLPLPGTLAKPQPVTDPAVESPGTPDANRTATPATPATPATVATPATSTTPHSATAVPATQGATP